MILVQNKGRSRHQHGMRQSRYEIRVRGPCPVQELCSILNGVIRADRASGDALPPAAKLCRGINELCITRRTAKAGELAFPRGGRCFRGGALPDQHRAFFRPGAPRIFCAPPRRAAPRILCAAENAPWKIHVGGGRGIGATTAARPMLPRIPVALPVILVI